MTSTAAGAPAPAPVAPSTTPLIPAAGDALAEAPSWEPSMDDIRKAHIAQASALEAVVSALAVQHQSSIDALRRQVEAIMAWQSKQETRDQGRERQSIVSVSDMAQVENCNNLAHVPSVVIGDGRDRGEVAPPKDPATRTVEAFDHKCDQEKRKKPLIAHHRQEWDTSPIKQFKSVPASNGDLTILMNRVATLERDMLKLQGMWDMNKGQRVIEVWMGLLKKKTYKPDNCDDQLECAVITLQNWWRDMLATKLDWESSSSEGGRAPDANEEMLKRDTADDNRSLDAFPPAAADDDDGNDNEEEDDEEEEKEEEEEEEEEGEEEEGVEKEEEEEEEEREKEKKKEQEQGKEQEKGKDKENEKEGEKENEKAHETTKKNEEKENKNKKEKEKEKEKDKDKENEKETQKQEKIEGREEKEDKREEGVEVNEEEVAANVNESGLPLPEPQPLPAKLEHAVPQLEPPARSTSKDPVELKHRDAGIAVDKISTSRVNANANAMASPGICAFETSLGAGAYDTCPGAGSVKTGLGTGAFETEARREEKAPYAETTRGTPGKAAERGDRVATTRNGAHRLPDVDIDEYCSDSHALGVVNVGFGSGGRNSSPEIEANIRADHLRLAVGQEKLPVVDDAYQANGQSSVPAIHLTDTVAIKACKEETSLGQGSWPVVERGEENRETAARTSQHSVTHHRVLHHPKHSTPQSPGRRRRASRGHYHAGLSGSEGGVGVQGLFDGAKRGSPVLMITSMAMQLQSLETEVDNVRQQMESIEASLSRPTPTKQDCERVQSARKDNKQPPEHRNSEKRGVQPELQHSDQWHLSAENFNKISQRMGQLQQELKSVHEREADREKGNELSLETIEALINAKDEDTSRRFREQTEQNAHSINTLREELGSHEAQERSDIVRRQLTELKLELRSLYASLEAISSNEVSATLLRALEGIRHLLASLAERAKKLEDVIGDPAKLARSIVADDVVARRFADMATDLGTTLFAFIKAQVLQARRARYGSFADDTAHRRTSSPDAASAVIAANVASGKSGDAAEERDGGRAGTSASPQAWAKLSSLTYTRDRTSEKLSFPAGLVALLKAISDVLNYCVGTGDLAVRLSVTLEDLTVYVAQRADKERESVVRQLGAPVEGVRVKLGEMENTLEGFQRTMHLVLSEVDADRERSAAIKELGTKVQEMQILFSRVSGELESKAGASEIEAALKDMTSKINESADQRSRLQRLARKLGNDENSTAAMKRLQIDLEQARSVAVLALAPRDNAVLIGSKCLSCNRPLGGSTPPPLPKASDNWYTGAGGLGASRDRVIEATTAGGGSDQGLLGDGGGGAGGGGSIGTFKLPGRTQAVVTPGKIIPPAPEGAGRAGGAVSSKGLQGPLLFEREEGAKGAPSATGLKGRVLRGGGATAATDGNVSVSKYPRLVPLTAPKSAPATDKLYSATNGRVTVGGTQNHRRSSSVAPASQRTRSILDDVAERGKESK